MSRILSTTLYSLVAGGLLLVGVVIFLGRPVASNKHVQLLPKEVVRNFDDCKNRGYQLLGDYNEQCRTPDDGTVFLDLRTYAATSSTEVKTSRLKNNKIVQ